MDIQWDTFGFFLEALTSPWQHFEEKKFGKKNYTFLSFPGKERKKNELALKIFWQCCQNCSVRLETNLYRNSTLFEKIFSPKFWTRSRKTTALWQSFSRQNCSNWIRRVLEICFGKLNKIYPGFHCFIPSLDFDRNLFWLFARIFWQVC